MNLGNAFLSLNNYNEAIVEYNRAIKISKRLIEEGQNNLCSNLLMCYENMMLLNCSNINYREQAINSANEVIKFLHNIIRNGQITILPTKIVFKVIKTIFKNQLFTSEQEKIIEEIGRAFGIKIILIKDKQ